MIKVVFGMTHPGFGFERQRHFKSVYILAWDMLISKISIITAGTMEST